MQAMNVFGGDRAKMAAFTTFPFRMALFSLQNSDDLLQEKDQELISSFFASSVVM